MKYDNSVRYEAFETYILTGSLASTAIACSLSADTVRDWSKEENWPRVYGRVLSADRTDREQNQYYGGSKKWKRLTRGERGTSCSQLSYSNANHRLTGAELDRID